jgi:hypothetical protein
MTGCFQELRGVLVEGSQENRLLPRGGSVISSCGGKTYRDQRVLI